MLTPQQKSQIKDYRKDGLTYDQIVSVTGINRSSVRYVLNPETLLSNQMRWYWKNREHRLKKMKVYYYRTIETRRKKMREAYHRRKNNVS